MQRGLSQEDAVALLVNGFVREVLQELPMEFAVEAQKLVAISWGQCRMTHRLRYAEGSALPGCDVRSAIRSKTRPRLARSLPAT